MNKRALSRVLAAFLAVVMTLGVFAALSGIGDSSVRAETATEVPRKNIPEIDYANANGKITLGKDAWLEADGTYTIQLSSYSTGVMNVIRKTGVVATDFIIVCDLSSSMQDVQTVTTIDENGKSVQVSINSYNLASLKAALGELISSIRSSSDEYAKHRVSLVTYGRGWMLGYVDPDHNENRVCKSTGFYRRDQDKGFVGGVADSQMDTLLEQHYDKAMFDVTDNDQFNRLMKNAEGLKIESEVETAMDWGMKMAYQIAKLHNEDKYDKPTGEYDEHGNMRTQKASRNQVVIVMTDGAPGLTGFSATVAAKSLNYASAIKRLPGNKTTIFTTDLRCMDFWDAKAEKWGARLNYPLVGDLSIHSATFKAVNENGEYDERLLLKHTDGIPYYKRGWTGWNTRWWDKSSAEYSAAKVQEALQAQQARYEELGLQEGFLLRDLLYLMSSDYEAQNPDMPKGRVQAYALSTADMWRLYRYFNTGAYRPFGIVGTGEAGHVNENFQSEMFGLNENSGYRWPAYNRWGILQSGLSDKDTSRNWNLKNGWYTKYAVFDNAEAPKRYTTYANPDYNSGAYFDLPANMLPGYITENISEQIRDKTHYQRGIVYVVRLQSGNNQDYVTIGGNYVNYMITKLVHPNGGYFAQEGYQDELPGGGTRNVNIKQLMYDEDADGNLTLKCKYYIPVNVRGDAGLIDPVLGINTEAAKDLVKAFLDFEDYSYEVTTVESNMGQYAAMVDTLSEDFYIDENCEVKIYTDAIKSISGDTYTFSNQPVEITDNPGVGAKIDVAGKKITVYGFDFSADENICKNVGGTASGKKVIAVITGVLAHDTASGTLCTNIENRSGLTGGKDDVRPSDFDTSNGKKTLLFPKPEVRIRDKYVVYDYGFRLTDDNLPGFFSDEGDNQDVGHVVSIDFLFNRQRNSQGALNYHNEYPYVGARGMDADGNPIAEYTNEMLANEMFKVGFEMSGFNPNVEHPVGAHACTGYFEPHAIARRDYRVAALLKLNNGTYEWSTLTFIPATNVLYEAEQGVGDAVQLNNKKMKMIGDFGTFWSGREKSSGSWAATAQWEVAGSFNESSTQEHYNKLYGYDPAYNGQRSFGNGAAMKVRVNDELYRLVEKGQAQWPVARFTFEGSGFSFTTMCNVYSGIFAVDVVPKGESTNYIGEEGTYLHQFVNTRYYGASDPNADPDPNADRPITIPAETLYQVPVIRDAHMVYGEYDVYITPVYFPAWAAIPGNKGAEELKDGDVISGFPGLEAKNYTVVNAVENGGTAEAVRGDTQDYFECYIDSFRVYHPRGASVHKRNIDSLEYYNAHEMNATYIEVRNIILAGIADIENDTENGFNGAIFMDYGPTNNGTHINEAGFDPSDPDTFTAMAYSLLGPNNEMYLPQGGSFTFNLKNPTEITNLHISAKTLTAADAKMKVTYVYNGGSNETSITRNVKSTTEMYYDIGHEGEELLVKEGITGIKIECTEGVLSLLNIKTVYVPGFELHETDPVSGDETNPNFNPSIISDMGTLELANAMTFGTKGDVNFDGSINVQDAILALRAAMLGTDLGISGNYWANCDGEAGIDINDALSIIRAAILG